MKIRRSDERGLADHGWLRSFHTFSFADYHDPQHMGFRTLRVINEDRVQPGQGFGRHPHRDMEIVSYVLEGALEHKDSMGNGSVIRPGEVQRMSAGTGVFHSEFNASKTELVHFLQIWILPDRAGHTPGYEQKAFSEEERRGKLRLVASPDGAEGSVRLHQDARLLVGLLADGESTSFELRPSRGAWVHVARGIVDVSLRTLASLERAAVDLNGTRLSEGDAAAIDQPAILTLTGAKGTGKTSEVLVFDLA